MNTTLPLVALMALAAWSLAGTTSAVPDPTSPLAEAVRTLRRPGRDQFHYCRGGHAGRQVRIQAEPCPDELRGCDRPYGCRQRRSLLQYRRRGGAQALSIDYWPPRRNSSPGSRRRSSSASRRSLAWMIRDCTRRYRTSESRPSPGRRSWSRRQRSGPGITVRSRCISGSTALCHLRRSLERRSRKVSLPGASPALAAGWRHAFGLKVEHVTSNSTSSPPAGMVNPGCG